MRVAFIHPDLGIGGAERLVVDAALGLQSLGHTVDIYTSHHDRNHCFDETRDGRLRVFHVPSPFPRSLKGKLHILFAHARQLHLTAHLLRSDTKQYDVYFVDQLSTCVPLLRWMGHTRVVFYCHFPDKLLANGAFVEGNLVRARGSLLKRIYRYPMDWLEEVTTRQADIILANSNFTARVFRTYFSSIPQNPTVVYPGINITAYESETDSSDPQISAILSDRPTLLSLNRFEEKKNVALALQAFASVKARLSEQDKIRLVLAGGYDPRVEDNVRTLSSLVNLALSHSLTYNIISPTNIDLSALLSKATPNNPHVLFLLSFTTPQRTALLTNPSTVALLYTPANEHFGIGPVEAMCCGVPVLACNSGGPTESIIDHPHDKRTGWLRAPEVDTWTNALVEILGLSKSEREGLGRRAKERARGMFGMEAMSRGLEACLQDAEGMGRVQGMETWWIMVFGFFLAYLIGPLIWPSGS